MDDVDRPFHNRDNIILFSSSGEDRDCDAGSSAGGSEEVAAEVAAVQGLGALIPPVLQGNAYLIIVSLLWGSYTPALRTIFTLPGAPSPLVVAAARGLLQAALLGAAVVLSASPRGEPDEVQPLDVDDTSRPFGLSPLLRGSLEIGAYNTAGTLLQTWGLSVRPRA